MKTRTRALAFLVALMISGTAALWIADDPIAASRVWRRLELGVGGTRIEGTDGVMLQRSWWDCGPAALFNLLARMGTQPPSLDSLVVLTAGAPPRGTRLGAIAEAAESLGFRSALFRASPGTLDRIDLPALAWFDRRHFVVLSHRDDSGYTVILDPEVGRYRLAPASLHRRWSGQGLRLTPR